MSRSNVMKQVSVTPSQGKKPGSLAQNSSVQGSDIFLSPMSVFLSVSIPLNFLLRFLFSSRRLAQKGAMPLVSMSVPGWPALDESFILLAALIFPLFLALFFASWPKNQSKLSPRSHLQTLLVSLFALPCSFLVLNVNALVLGFLDKLGFFSLLARLHIIDLSVPFHYGMPLTGWGSPSAEVSWISFMILGPLGILIYAFCKGAILRPGLRNWQKKKQEQSIEFILQKSEKPLSPDDLLGLGRRKAWLVSVEVALLACFFTKSSYYFLAFFLLHFLSEILATQILRDEGIFATLPFDLIGILSLRYLKMIDFLADFSYEHVFLYGLQGSYILSLILISIIVAISAFFLLVICHKLRKTPRQDRRSAEPAHSSWFLKLWQKKEEASPLA